MILAEQRFLVKAKITPLAGLYHFQWDGGQGAAKFSKEELALLLRRVGAKDYGTLPRSARKRSYLSMVQGFHDGTAPHAWLWSTNLGALTAALAKRQQLGEAIDPNSIQVNLPDGIYNGTIKGHTVTLESGLKLDGFYMGLRNIFPANVMVTVKDHRATWDLSKKESTIQESIGSDIDGITPSRELPTDLPDGTYTGTIKGHCVTLENGQKLDGFELGLKNITPAPVVVTVKDGKATWKLSEKPIQELDQAMVEVPPQNEKIDPKSICIVPETHEITEKSEVDKTFPKHELEALAQKSGKSVGQVEELAQKAITIASEEFGKEIEAFGPKEKAYAKETLNDLLTEGELIMSKISVQEFMASTKTAKKFIEDVTSTDMPGARTLPIRAAELVPEKPHDPIDDVEMATKEADKNKEVEQEAGELKVVPTGSGTSEEPKPKETEAPEQNIKIETAEELH